MDVDVLSDSKVRRLVKKEGSEGFYLWFHILTEVAKDLDIDNEKNGYLDTAGMEPSEFLEGHYPGPKDRVKEILDEMAEAELIDPSEYKNGEIYLPKFLERDQTQTYLRRQEAGRETGKKDYSKDSNKGALEGSLKGNNKGDDKDTALDKDKDKDKDKDSTSTSGGEETSPDYSVEYFIDEYGEGPYKATAYLIEQLKEFHPKKSYPQPGEKKMERWVKEMDRFNRIGLVNGSDGFSLSEIKNMIDWVYSERSRNGDFWWADQIQSVQGLRDKAERFYKQALDDQPKNNGPEKGKAVL